MTSELDNQAEEIFEAFEKWLTIDCDHGGIGHPFYCAHCGPKFFGLKAKYCYIPAMEEGPELNETRKMIKLMKDTSERETHQDVIEYLEKEMSEMISLVKEHKRIKIDHPLINPEIAEKLAELGLFKKVGDYFELYR